MYNILNQKELDKLKKSDPQRFQYSAEGGVYLNLKGLPLKAMDGIDVGRAENLARVVRGYAFAAINGIKSGHPGGSSSKVEQILALLLSGVMAFNPLDPKNPGRDRIIWSAGHCTPLLHAILALIYEVYNRNGLSFEMEEYKGILPEKLARFGELHEKSKEVGVAVVMPKCLTRFRHCDGPTGHVESNFPLADASTGSSGHGFSVALGLATLHKSCGLDTKAFVIAGDAETEEGMSYEARNLIRTLGMDNLIVSLDYNGFGIDGPISEVISAPYVDYWFGAGWNVIEVDGHNVLELAYAYNKAAQGFGNKRPVVVVCHTVKGKHYGKLEGTADSHGTPAKQEEYVEIMKNLGFNVPGVETEVAKDIDVVSGRIIKEDADYLLGRLEAGKKLLKPEKELAEKMAAALKGRPLVDYKKIKRPDVLPPELVFSAEGGSASGGEVKVPTRKATEAFFKWLMAETAFFYLGSGDLMKSILTGAGENVYGILSKENPLGRGIRFGIAEQNMAMMSAALTQDVLPGGFQAMSAFASYGVFTSIMSNSVRMALINNAVNPRAKGFFIVLAAHDGPETGEDGPTHHGLFWMSLFNAYPGIKVYKPMDANETIEMLFHAMDKGEPVAFSVMRPPTPVLKRGLSADGSYTIPPAREAVNGAYVFKPFKENGPSTSPGSARDKSLGAGKRKMILAICGGQVMQNVLEILPELEEQNNLDVKIVAVTSPELYEELKKNDPQKAQTIISDEERQYVVTLHNGWPGFMHPFILPPDYPNRVIGIDKFLKSGPPSEVYEVAGFSPQALKEKIVKAL